jgi:SOS-response transcriptional repressor LexA
VPANQQVAYLVRGNHAENIGISDGSGVVVGKGVTPRSGEFIVAELARPDGTAETTIRKFQDGSKYTVVGLILSAIKTF